MINLEFMIKKTKLFYLILLMLALSCLKKNNAMLSKIDKIKLYLKFGPNPYKKIFWQALAFNKTTILDLCIKNGFDINTQDENLTTPLIAAIIFNNNESCKYLLNFENININLNDIKGKSPLEWAINNFLYGAENLEIIKLIMNHKHFNIDSCFDEIILEIYLCNNKEKKNKVIEILKLILNFKNIDVHKKINYKKYNNISLLSVTLQEKLDEIIEIILTHPSYNFNKEKNFDLLNYAIKNNNKNILKLFLEHKSFNLNIKDKDKRSLFKKIVLDQPDSDIEEEYDSENSSDFDSELSPKLDKKIENSLKIDENISYPFLAKSKNDPLYPVIESIVSWKEKIYQAIKNNDFNTFKFYLLKFGSICFKDREGNNLLHYAMKAGNLDFIKLIIYLKPDLIWKKNKRGEIPLSFMLANYEVFKFFRSLNLNS